MGYDLDKNIELYLLKAESFSEEAAPNQRKYYLEAAQWMKENNFATAEEAVAAMRNTEYYEGASIAKTADDKCRQLFCCLYIRKNLSMPRMQPKFHGSHPCQTAGW